MIALACYSLILFRDIGKIQVYYDSVVPTEKLVLYNKKLNEDSYVGNSFALYTRGKEDINVTKFCNDYYNLDDIEKIYIEGGENKWYFECGPTFDDKFGNGSSLEGDPRPLVYMHLTEE